MMNNYAQKLNLQDTHFETVHGLDAPCQHSSAYDLAVLSRAIIHGEPDFYHMYSEKSLTRTESRSKTVMACCGIKP